MNHKIMALAAIVALVGFVQADASIISVSGPASSAGALPAIIAAPSDVLNSTVANLGQQGFDEQQGVTLANNYSAGWGGLTAGQLVDSHMIFLNKPDSMSGSISHEDVTWTFSGDILAVMYNGNGSHEVTSTPELGAIGTNYPAAPFPARGLEGADNFSVAGNILDMDLDMYVSQPGDWIRVVTEASPGPPVPEPASIAVWSVLGAIALGIGWRRRRRSV